MPGTLLSSTVSYSAMRPNSLWSLKCSTDMSANSKSTRSEVGCSRPPSSNSTSPVIPKCMRSVRSALVVISRNFARRFTSSNSEPESLLDRDRGETSSRILSSKTVTLAIRRPSEVRSMYLLFASTSGSSGTRTTLPSRQQLPAPLRVLQCVPRTIVAEIHEDVTPVRQPRLHLSGERGYLLAVYFGLTL